MAKKMIEIAVIGGGPAGLLAAREAAKRGVEVAVFEKDAEVGEPERCAGLLSLNGLERLSIGGSKKYLQNIVRGAVFHTESGREYFLDARRPIAAVVSRKIFDQKLAEDSEKAGARILTGVRVRRVLKRGNEFELLTDAEDFRASWIIDAEGAGSVLLRKTLGKAPEASGWLPIIQFIIKGHDLPKDFVHLYFLRDFPDFFAYFIPIDEELGKVGAASRNTELREKLMIFLRRAFPEARILKRVSHVIYTGKPLQDFCFSYRFVPVGDAAGHVKATTGGGVIMGGLLSISLTSAIAEGLRGGSPRPYLERAQRILEELVKISYLRDLLYKIPLPLYDILFGLLTSRSATAYLARSGDMDFQFSSLLGRRRDGP